MKVESVRIQNFRSIRDMTVELDDLTILIGANGTGKTTVLDALALFASDGASVTHDDFLGKSRQIKITLAMRTDGHNMPARFLHNGVVELQRSFSRYGRDRNVLSAALMANTDFDGVRKARLVSDRQKAINEVREKYPDFPRYTNMAEWKPKFAQYELRLSQMQEHQGKFKKRFIGVSKDEIDLPGMLEVVVVPTVRDISGDGEEKAGSYLSELMNLAIRSAQKNDKRLKKIAEARDNAYTEYVESVRGTIEGLNKKLGLYASRYMTGAEFVIEQERPEQLPAGPSASVRMWEGGFGAPIGRVGSGAQRVYLLSLLDTIASILKESRKKGGKQDGPAPVRLIAIDEPELYQHPQRQKRILSSLADIVESDSAVRVVCCTHSPYFVRLERVHGLRRLQRDKKDRIRSASPDRLARLLLPKKKWRTDGGRGELAKWLDMSATHWVTEGFFAKLVVITEGQGDRSMLLATADAMGIDLGRHEITVVPATGVENVEKFARMFGEFGIPVYVVWDRDGRWDEGRDRARAEDERIAKVASGGTFNGSLRKTVVEGGFACVEGNLTVALARNLLECKDALGGSAGYEDLKSAIKQDKETARREEQRRKSRQGKGGGKTPGHKIFHDAQKDFLNNRQNTLGMLEAVRKSDPGRLESFTAVEIVRKIDEAGRAASSEITRIDYDRGSLTLCVEFRGGHVDEFHGVPKSAHDGLQKAESWDEHFYANIRGRYGRPGTP